MEEKRIIELLFDRSEQALTELDTKYGRLCHSLANNILRNPSDSEECVNDAYLGVWNTIPPTRPDSLMAYVCKIVRNLSLKRYQYNTAAKRNSNMDVALEELDGCLAAASDVEQQVETAELTKAIEQFMDQLKQTDRVIFMRRYYFADSYDTIAQITGLSEKNVSVKLARTRSKLRKHLEERGYIV